MQHIKTGNRRGLFDVLAITKNAQAAMMTLRPGQSSSDEIENEHPRCEQWLFVITCTGRAPLITINFYAPPAYTKNGDLMRSAK